MDLKRKRISRCQTSKGKSTSNQNAWMQSPLSAIRHNRLAEKVELQGLSDHLNTYVVRIIHLETENSCLNGEIQSNDQINMVENSSIKEMFDMELANARKALDDIAQKKVRLELKNKSLSEENAKLNTHLEKMAKELNAAEQLKQIIVDYEKAVEDCKKRKEKVAKLKPFLNDMRSQSEEKTMIKSEGDQYDS